MMLILLFCSSRVKSSVNTLYYYYKVFLLNPNQPLLYYSLAAAAGWLYLIIKVKFVGNNK